MRRLFHTLLLIICLNVAIGAEEANQVKLAYDETITPINLKSAIEQALRKNHDEEMRAFDKEILQLNYKDARDQFWLPNIKLEAVSNYDRLGHLFSTQKNNAYDIPSGYLSLNLGDYTIFNWGKDYLAFLNNKTTYEREKEKLNEERRELKFQVILKYLELLTYSEILKAKHTQLRHASFIYRFNYDKAKEQKVSKQQYYQSKTLYLKAQEEYHQAKSEIEQLDRDLSYLINDSNDAHYLITEQIKFKRLKSDLNDLIALGLKNNSNVLNSISKVTTTDRSYQIAKKENLPLPKFSLHLGAYKYSFDDNHSATDYSNDLGSDGIDFTASINASWNITGTNGFLNRRRTKKAVLERNKAILDLSKSKTNVQNDVKALFMLTSQYERRHSILKTDVEALQNSFDVILDNYTAKKTNFLDFKDILEDKTKREIELTLTKFYHAQAKILLAQTCGLDDLTGESLEQLTELKEE